MDANPPSSATKPSDRRLGYFQKIAKFIRMLATGLCFICFMTGGVLLTLFVFPVLKILPMSRSKKMSVGLGIMRRCFALFMGIMQWLGPIRSFQVEGLEEIRDGGPFLFIANHPALIDVVAILSVLPQCNCIVKGALFNNPFFGGVLRMANYIPNRNAPELMALCEESVRGGRSLMIFPEGTRSPKGGLRSFNRGAAQIALRCRVKVVPIVVTCHPPTLMKGQPWYEIPDEPVQFKLEFQPPLALPEQDLAGKPFPVQVRVLNQQFHTYFKEKLELV